MPKQRRPVKPLPRRRELQPAKVGILPVDPKTRANVRWYGSKAALLTIASVCKYIDAPESTVRWWVHANVDGFNTDCVVKIGGRVYIDKAAMVDWIEKRRRDK